MSYLAHWPRRRGKLLLLIIGNWKEWPYLLETVLRLQRSMGKFLINTVLGVTRWKKQQNFPHETFCLFVFCNWNVSRSNSISRNILYPENSWLHPCRPPWLANEGNSWVLDQLEHSLFQWFHTLKPLHFKAYFLFTWHLEWTWHLGLLQFKYKCIYLLVTSMKNKQYTS